MTASSACIIVLLRFSVQQVNSVKLIVLNYVFPVMLQAEGLSLWSELGNLKFKPLSLNSSFATISGFRPDSTQNDLYSHRIRLEA